MRIQANAGRGGDVRDSIKKLTLTADNDSERELVTAVYRIVGGDTLQAKRKGAAWLREFVQSFPEPAEESHGN